MKFNKTLFATLTMAMASVSFAKEPITIAEQGSFTVGGSFVQHSGTFKPENFVSPDGQRAYGDFAYVKYQKPVNAKKLPLIFQHGGAQSSRTWEMTVDGREGFDSLFVRKGYSVYLLDQPRSGKASLSTQAVTPDTPAIKPCGFCPEWAIMMRMANLWRMPNFHKAKRLTPHSNRRGRLAAARWITI